MKCCILFEKLARLARSRRKTERNKCVTDGVFKILSQNFLTGEGKLVKRYKVMKEDGYTNFLGELTL